MAKKRNTRRRRGAQSSPASRRSLLQRMQRWLLAGILITAGLAALLAWVGGEDSRAARWLDEWRYRPRPLAGLLDRRVGVIAGHMDFDTGAVCPDGLTEAETAQEIARRVVQRLERAGVRAELLAEYDERLNGYAADALVSIHIDSCLPRSGFKIARAQLSAIPQREDALVNCLSQHYAEATGLAFDSYTITEDMRGYHAFQRVNPQTAAVIIEVGFLGGDRRLLTGRPEAAARGVADGVVCFLQR